MREVADQLLVGLCLVQRTLLAVLPRLLLDLDQLDDHRLAGGVEAVHLVDDHVHRQRIAVSRHRPLQLGLEPAGGVVVAHDRRHRVAQRLRVDEPVEQRAAQHAAPRKAQHVLEGGVGEQAVAVRVDDGHHGGQVVERGEGGRCEGRRAGAVLRRRNGLHHGPAALTAEAWPTRA